MGALRLDSARPFDAKIEIHCAKYFKISVATPRPLKFSFSTNSRKLAEQKNPQPVGHQPDRFVMFKFARLASYAGFLVMP
jgi:hypothetical protein